MFCDVRPTMFLSPSAVRARVARAGGSEDILDCIGTEFPGVESRFFDRLTSSASAVEEWLPLAFEAACIAAHGSIRL